MTDAVKVLVHHRRRFDRRLLPQGTQWAEYCADSQFDADVGYLHLAEFARHLISLWQAGRVAEPTQAFGAIERLHVDGDDYVREAATLGFLETLQNNAEHSDLDPEIFSDSLRAASARWWDALNRFWAGESPRVELEPPSPNVG
jgi:hypothetical protein